ncbi:MAG: oligosaccharide flippase family protein [Thiotrichaceae bacterium]|nr:oligosaccharide flippase family protein [Thiotrichaceae bacterium]
MSETKRFLQSSLLSVIARFTGVGLNFGLQILIARLLIDKTAVKAVQDVGLSHYGDLKMMLTLITGIALFSRLGVDQLIVKEIASYEDNRMAHGAQLQKQIYKLIFISSTFFMLFWIIFSPWIKDALFDDVSMINFNLASLGILFFNLVTLNAYYLKALHRASGFALIQNALPALSFLILVVAFWEWFPSDELYINLYTLSTIVAGVASLLIIIPLLKQKKLTYNVSLRLKNIAKRSLPLAPVSITAFLMLWSDTIMVGLFLDADKVGLYSTAASISFISLFFLGALDATIIPKLLFKSKNTPKEFKSFFWKATALVVFGLLAVTVFMGLLAKPMLSLFGTIFQQATLSLIILLSAQWLRATSLTFSFMFIIKEQVKYLNIIMVIALIINLVANTILINAYGIEGAAVATLLANTFLAMASVLLFYHKKLLADY